VKEVRILGEWAYAWTILVVTVIPKQGADPIRRSGDILTIFRRDPEGAWVIARDANMLVVQAGGQSA
jgi:hypothetical protein